MLQISFHPAVQTWFKQSFAAATEVQTRAWQAIQQGQHTLLAAPTGSGKTLAAFLAAIDRLIKQGLQQPLTESTQVLYISPLKALSNDIQANLQHPLQGIREQLQHQGLPDVDIKAWVRSGDTPQAERQKAIRHPPHILVTTPESFYILLTSASGRNMLATVSTVIVDEIHALAGDKRGVHLALSLERLQALTGRPLQRIGLSATQKPISDMANFLLGQRTESCVIIDTGHSRQRDMAMWVPDSPLQALMSNEVWQEIYDALENLVRAHRSTLIFVNTRRLAERAARFLAERLGDEQVMSHHGSMAKEKRLTAEQRLKKGELKCLVATASLELGIDIGDVDLVCQLGSPRSIAVFLQRVGRSGHHIGGIPKGRLFPLSRDELVETTALLHAANNGVLDRIIMPQQALDILAQQIVAEVASRDWEDNKLYTCFKQAWPYRHLSRQDFTTVVQMLAQGFSTRRGRRAAHIHFDAVHGLMRGRQGARLTALTNGGAIPDQFDYEVVLTPENIRVGTLNEDFAFESLPGDIFQLGNTSYRILKTEQGKVFVADAKGEPPNIPFWFGEAAGRTDELSEAVSELRQQLNDQLDKGSAATLSWLQKNYPIPTEAAIQLLDYLAAAKAALSQLPTRQQIIFERFMDEVGDMHFVIHSTYGSRINRAWGLALRKRFCRKFNFELQAAALEDSIILSLSATHSFPLEEVAGYLNAKTVTDVLIQALLDVPMFATRWRWNATIALAVKRFMNGKRSPPYFQRADAEDLVAVIFPDQLACLENIPGNRDIPEHPLIQQTLSDCLHITMDSEGLVTLLQQIGAGEVFILCKDLAGPSPLSQEMINARPYAFLDDAPAEERRTLAIRSKNYPNPEDAAALGELNPAAIEQVREQAWPLVRHTDELHDALMLLGFVDSNINDTHSREGKHIGIWQGFFNDLTAQGRATALNTGKGKILWVAVERLPEMLQIFPGAQWQPPLSPLSDAMVPENRNLAIREILRSRLECLGPVSAAQLAVSLGIAEQEVESALLSLEQEGFIFRGCFDVHVHNTANKTGQQWCERHLLARIHRYTIKQLRNEIKAVSVAAFMRFLLHWQGLTNKREGAPALSLILTQLEGFCIAAAAWETDIISARLSRYTSDLLDGLCASGQMAWLRLAVSTSRGEAKTSVVKNTPITLVNRQNILQWRNLAPLTESAKITLTGPAQKVFKLLQQNGALFFVDLVQESGLLKSYAEQALGELVNWGLITSDNFAGLRALIVPQSKRTRINSRRGNAAFNSQFDRAGRWSLLKQSMPTADSDADQSVEFLAWVLLRRYGIVFRKLLQRESFVPPWRELLRVFWRLEARGEIRGGRFVEGVAGEQFALPEALSDLRKHHKQAQHEHLQVISAADPLNLTGIILPGEKISALQNKRILLRDGIAIALQHGQHINFFDPADQQAAYQAKFYPKR